MEEIPFLIYGLLSTIVPGLIVFALLSQYRKKKHVPRGRESVGTVIALGVYIMLVLYITGAGTIFDFLRHGFEYRPEQINVIPLLLDSYPMQYILNIVMFIPFGFLVSYIWPSASKRGLVVVYGAGFSLLIELSQLLNQRSTDIDDLIMNTLGAVIGLALFKLTRRRRNARQPEPISSKALPAVYLSAMFAGNYFLCNTLGLAKILYGF